MFRKKRIALLLFLAAACGAGWYYGAVYAVAAVALLLALLGALGLYKYALAHTGTGELRELSARYAYDELARRAREQTPHQEQYRFVVLGDTRNKKKVTSEVYGRAAAEEPAMLFHTGDIIRHGTAREFIDNHIALLADITDPVPMFCVPGNHERGARRDFAAFKALYGDDRFSFVFGPCQFIGFNNSTRKRVTRADLDFVDAELARATVPHRFVFMHIPPVFFEDTFSTEPRRRGYTENADELHEILVRHGVTEVFFAHIHGYASHVFDGVRYTLTAGGGAPLSKHLKESGASCFHYVVIHVSPAGIRREVVRKLEGTWQRAEA